MTPIPALDQAFSLHDGLGSRRLTTDDAGALVEVLDLAPHIAEDPGSEPLIRECADRFTCLPVDLVARVRSVERTGAKLRVISEVPEGARLSDLLTYLQLFENVLPDSGAIEMGLVVVRSVAALHQQSIGFAHGALSPAHVIITRAGTAVLTDCVFGAVIERLGLSRGRLWREYGLAAAPAANVPRFDQRADVTQLAAIVLAAALRRPLRADEYPRDAAGLVAQATSGPPQDQAGPKGVLRAWLIEALQMQPRLSFVSAVDAQRALAPTQAAVGSRRAGVQALQALVWRELEEPSSVFQKTRRS